jgi:hypothetical protein
MRSGRLMGYRVGLALEDGLAHGARIEQIERDRLRPKRAYRSAFSGDLWVPITSCPRSIK